MASDQTHDRTRRLEHLLLTREIEEFLYTEAALLDTHRFTEWLALLTEDVRCWMPMRRNVKFGEQERENTRAQHDINWFDEGKATLTQRVQQILTGVHWAEEPLSRVCHMVTTVQVVHVALPEVTVTCRFLVYRNRLQDETDLKVWENVGQYVAAGWGLDVIAVRIAGIYGPLFYHPAPFMAMSMVRATCTAAARGGAQPVYGTIPGDIPYTEMGADLCYVQDCARGMQLLQHAPKDTLKHTVYNLGSGRETTQGEVAAVVQQDVGYQPEWPLDRAIPDYIAWLRHNPE